MGRFALPLIVVLAVAMSAIVSPASAEIVLAQYDVFNDAGTWSADQFITNYIIAETFVPTVTGTVSSIQVPVSKTGAPTIPLSWEIRATHQSVMNGLQPVWGAAGALSTGSLAAGDCPNSLTSWTTVQMTPVELQTGQSYALVASAIGTNSVYRWWGKYGGSGYSGRHLDGYYTDPQEDLGSSSNDVGFRINGVPEPSSVVALLSGMVGLVGLIRRRK